MRRSLGGFRLQVDGLLEPRIRELAEREGLSLSAMARRLLREALRARLHNAGGNDSQQRRQPPSPPLPGETCGSRCFDGPPGPAASEAAVCELPPGGASRRAQGGALSLQGAGSALPERRSTHLREGASESSPAVQRNGSYVGGSDPQGGGRC